MERLTIDACCPTAGGTLLRFRTTFDSTSERVHSRSRDGQVVNDRGYCRPERQRSHALRIQRRNDGVARLYPHTAPTEPRIAALCHNTSVCLHDVDAIFICTRCQSSAFSNVIV